MATKQMKTLNGFEVVDAQARDDIELLKANAGSGDGGALDPMIMKHLFTGGIAGEKGGSDLQVYALGMDEETLESSFGYRSGAIIINGVTKRITGKINYITKTLSSAYKAAIGFRLDTKTGEITEQIWKYTSRSLLVQDDGLPLRIFVTGGGSIPSKGDNGYYDIILALIEIPKNTYEITEDMIIDTRGIARFCGYVESKACPEEEVVQSDLAQNDTAAADYVKNRTHYEADEIVNAPLNITWDGNVSGMSGVGAGDQSFYKMSDEVFTDEQIKLMTYTYCDTAVGDGVVGESAIADEWDDMVARGDVTEDIVCCAGLRFVRKAETKHGNENTYHDIGVYFGYDKNNMNVPATISYTNSLTTTEPVPHTQRVVHKLDRKYLPDDVATKADILGAMEEGY